MSNDIRPSTAGSRYGAENAPTRPATYVYVGDGLGVPGLAHEISLEQAQAEGTGELLKACIEIGVYVEKVEKATGKGK